MWKPFYRDRTHLSNYCLFQTASDDEHLFEKLNFSSKFGLELSHLISIYVELAIRETQLIFFNLLWTGQFFDRIFREISFFFRKKDQYKL